MKPSPAPIQHICSHWDVPCENTLMVGDDIQDIQSGNSAGSGKILYKTKFSFIKNIFWSGWLVTILLQIQSFWLNLVWKGKITTKANNTISIQF